MMIYEKEGSKHIFELEWVLFSLLFLLQSSQKILFIIYISCAFTCPASLSLPPTKQDLTQGQMTLCVGGIFFNNKEKAKAFMNTSNCPPQLY